jgi:hypothetical protein
MKQAPKKPVSISFSCLPFWLCIHEVLAADSPVQCYIFDFPNYDIYNASGLSYRVFIKPDSYRILLHILVYCSTQQSSAAFAIFDAISAFKGSKAIGLTSSRALQCHNQFLSLFEQFLVLFRCGCEINIDLEILINRLSVYCSAFFNRILLLPLREVRLRKQILLDV